MRKLQITKEEALKVIEILKNTYPNAKSGLKFTNPFELLIATILSAQCTDKRVNIITDRLFKKYKTPEDFLKLTPEELQEEIRECGLYRNKSKSILETCKILKEKYDSKVPETLEELLTLPGVGRKTANVVLSNAFSKQAIAVDTHVFRVSNRIGLADSKDVFTTEKQLMELIPENLWSLSHHLLIHHGRNLCTARKPKCDECPVNHLCLYFKGRKN
ncbi:DNA-(apurinic or apyrimidinic site) lyase /endonuclease III [Thermoanaerobacter thermohydrosulfuricus]|uniref:Endonuclease III n=1 Tax=Thermoanaerobacter thermohydrosulfuricus TaxID=1516 RepID=A0A1I2D6B6_THETY|nr:endonuclease III [Thermoanaerobacter ethanolicus JW 200]MBZ4655933.1 endonuclease [Thermoanaerobacter sp.]SDG23730.1 DNA-(apurinic or apyrimidinic site) lyase /endonuclease III [Thermoanaerobacter thermohydrosulfuricus]SFE76031.1 DNA-(apurinic or apyrimidinic site) lyase /endonuclease III [Thermoanaerobacter thermohydrosulfuricus]